MVKPLIKCRITGSRLRYVVIDPTFTTYKTITVFPPQPGIGTYNVFGHGPVQRHDTLHAALSFAVQAIALASAINANPANPNPAPMDQATAD